MSGSKDSTEVRHAAKSIKSLKDLTSQIAANDVSFYKTIDSSFAEKVDASASRVLSLINNLIESIDETADNIEPGKDAINDSWKSIGNVLDGLYEKSDIAFDSMQNENNNSTSGAAASKTAIGQAAQTDHEAAQKDGLIYMEESNEDLGLEQTKPKKRLAKPQLTFRVPVDNSESHPFKPKLTEKPHALEPFEESLKIIQPEGDNEPAHYKQPYDNEIINQPYPESILSKSEPIPSQPWPAREEPVWVDTIEKVEKMIQDLRNCPEIAVDLEHHDYRTYYGLVSLMQISNREKDWLIDTLALRDDLQPLNEIFTDPNVVKVFHGAFMDIIWLQRDLGLYIVSLFDTFHASRQLGFPKNSLAYLLERFANFKTNKKYQMADWRIRPLTSAMKLYARADTHFLLNIYDQLRNMLIDKSLLKFVLQDSRQVARRRFEYYNFRPSEPSNLVVTPIQDRIEPWRSIMNHYNISLTKKQLVIDLYNWRDKIARRDDESVRYIMPNQLLVSLVVMAPIDSSGVLASANYITEHVRMNAKEIARLIQASLKKSENEDLELLNAATFGIERDEAPHADNLTERQIHSSISKFNSLTRSVGSLFSSKPAKKSLSLLKSKSTFLPSDMIISDPKKFVWSVKFDEQDNNLAEVTVQDLLVRGSEIYEVLNSDTGKEVKTEIPLASQPVTSEVKETADPSKEIKPQKEDKNEIIILRRKVTRSKAKKPKATASVEETADEDFIDYKNADKILKNPEGRGRFNDKNPKKRKSYNPYGQEFEEPRAAKKVFNPARGKNLSYKKK